MARINIPAPLRTYTRGDKSITVPGDTVDQALGSLVEAYPDLKRHLMTEQGKLRSFVNVYVGDEDVRYLQQGATPIRDTDTLSIVPSVAGGNVAGPKTVVKPPSMERTAPAPAIANAAKLRLSNPEILRYSRHLIMPEVGMAGQHKLKAGSVLLIGAGGLGSPLGLYLAAAGIGRIGIVDYDVVDVSNLQRQIIHGTSWIGKPKLESARTRMLELNPYIQVDTYEEALTSENALRLFAEYDVIVDGTDNFPTRYLVNDACVLTGKPNVYGSIFRFDGQASVFDAKRGPCYRCLYPEPPPPGLVPSCAEGGVLGVLPGIIGTIQATETIKLILGVGEPLIGRLLLFDALEMSFQELKLHKNPECPVCGEHPTITELIDYERFCGISPEENLGEEWEITPKELAAKLNQDGKSLVLLDVREPVEWEIARLPNAKLIPRGELPARLNELNTADEMVVYCKTGARSAMAVQFLKQVGFRKLKNLRGGIDAWARQVDPSMPQY